MGFNATGGELVILVLVWLVPLALAIAVLWALFSIRSNAQRSREALERMEQQLLGRRLP